MSKTFLLTFNPKNNNWNNVQDDVDKLMNGEVFIDRYSCGNTKKINKGDRVFIIRLGSEPKGIFASGYVATDIFTDEHWNEEKRKEGKTANYIYVNFDYLCNYNNKDEMILMRKLKLIAEKYKWSSQTSGIEIPEKIAEILEEEWEDLSGLSKKLDESNFINIDETSYNHNYYEGAVTTITVNKYERDRNAREACIRHYGYTCSVCGLNMENIYGKLGKNKIHVHHIRALYTIGKKYSLDAIRDLRPVCANCHSIIHSKKPAYTIEEVKRNIADSHNSFKGA